MEHLEEGALCYCIFIPLLSVEVLQTSQPYSEVFTPQLCLTLTLLSDIATRQTEGNYQQVAAEVASIMEDYNTLLCQSLSGVAGGAS